MSLLWTKGMMNQVILDSDAGQDVLLIVGRVAERAMLAVACWPSAALHDVIARLN